MEYFVLGMIFIIVGQPILEALTSLILSGLDVIKSKFVYLITKQNSKIYDEPKRKIGFEDPREKETEDEL